VYRANRHDSLEALARYATVPVVNALTDREHPCQILADWMTLAERYGGVPALRGKVFCYVGDGNNMLHSYLLGAPMLGMHVQAACPKGYEPDPEILAQAKALAEAAGTTITIVRQPTAALKGADIVATDTWVSMGDEAEVLQRQKAFAGYTLTEELLDQHAAPDAVFLHCLRMAPAASSTTRPRTACGPRWRSWSGCWARNPDRATSPGTRVQVRDLGRMEYGACLQLQHELRDARQRGEGEDVLLMVEHPPVATLGRRGSEEEVFDKSLPVFVIERGGKATYHAPGQLVLYPIVHLGEGNRDVRAWVQHLERFVIDLLAAHGILARIEPDLPGVWTGPRKIASIGIAIQHWVSFHGIAVNVTLEPKEFERIDPCGLGAQVMTSMQREGSPASLLDVKQWAVDHGPAHFDSFHAKRKSIAD
jgi:lipoate-protein ligase B